MATINGTNGGDSLYGGAAADVTNGLNGNDTLKGFGGADRLDGGAGIDTVFYGDSSAGVGINLATGRGVGGSAEGDTLISIENVFGSNFNDTLTGTSGANQLHGQDGNDVIKGGGGNDFLLVGNGESNILRGQAGQDNLIGGGGADVMYGGTDSDAYYVDNAGDVVWEYAGEGTGDYVIASTSYALTAGSEIEQLQVDSSVGTAPINLTGNEFNNFIFGSSGDNVINGGGGADYMSGGKGNDTYIVDNVGDSLFENGDIHSTPENESEGFDSVLTSVSFNVGLYSEIEVLQAIGSANVNLTGSLDNNRIIGNSGTSIIDGSYGKDTLTGGGALDVFIWSNVNEIGLFNFDPDIVTDLNRAEGDLLHFTLIDADET